MTAHRQGALRRRLRRSAEYEGQRALFHAQMSKDVDLYLKGCVVVFWLPAGEDGAGGFRDVSVTAHSVASKRISGVTAPRGVRSRQIEICTKYRCRPGYGPTVTITLSPLIVYE